MRPARRQRPLAPLMVERMVAGVAFGALAPVTLAIAAAGDRPTVWREVRICLPLAAFVALAAEFGGGAESLICGTVAPLLVWNALYLRRWERRAGTRIYRERRFWARGAPFFYLVRVESLADSEG